VRFPTLALPATAAAAALWLILPSASAWTDQGFILSTENRDFRVFNNFTDVEANDNTVEHPSFPGFTGATLAIWKACVEWGSMPHGDGNGDPGQIGGLGSGGANFDPSFQGLALSAGEIGDNTHSEKPGCAGGVHAFTSSFLDGDGWRTFYYECWRWEDNPNPNWNPEVGRLDLQGIATHEFGHALGLGHSADTTATMFANTVDGKSHRTIEADDIAGVQALYGVTTVFKPTIADLSINGEVLTISGSNFGTSGNEVWFTRGSGVGDGTPVKVSDVTSAGNAVITVTVPAEAGPGDVLVRSGPITGSRLSNAYPFDERMECDPVKVTCDTTPNSVGSGARIVITGSQSISAGTFTLNSLGSPANEFGLFFYGPGTTLVPAGNGNLCVSGPLFRLGAVQTDSLGRASFSVDFGALPQNGAIQSGSTWHFQWWYRDPGVGANFDFSDAVAVPFCN
jgi:matrixin